MIAGVLRRRPLATILLLGAALRIWAALTPGFHHPDAIYQYLEPAHRLLTGEGVVTWEWREGMRSWLLPALLAMPMAAGRLAGPTSDLGLALPRIAVALASLGIVWASWTMGARLSRLHAVLAAFVAATWFEFVFFGVQTLAEPLATAAMLPAAALLIDASGPAGEGPSPDATAYDEARIALGESAALTGQEAGRRVAAGLLLGFAILLRPHYAPAAAVLAIISCRHHLIRALPAIILGGILALAVGAGVDLATGTLPFHWMIENVRLNIVEHRADRYGVGPPLEFVAWYLTLWRWWTVPLLVGVRFGAKAAPALLAAALVNLVVHSLIGHKEYRFVFFTTAALVTISALGWASLLTLAASRWPAQRVRIATLAVFAGWTVTSPVLGFTGKMVELRGDGRAGSILFADVRHDRAACGVALIEGLTFGDVPGQVALRHDVPMSIFVRNDFAYQPQGERATIARWAPTYNRIVTTRYLGRILPPGYARGRCEPWDGRHVCLYARPGGCAAANRSPFAASTSLRRLSL